MDATPRELGPTDGALADALREDAGELVDLRTLAERSELSPALLEVLAREGLLPSRGPDLYAEEDLGAVRAGFALLEAGLPLDELLRLARDADDALRSIASAAVELFLDFVRDPVHGTVDDQEEAAARLVTSFHTMLPAAERLVGMRFRQLVREAAAARTADGPGTGSTSP